LIGKLQTYTHNRNNNTFLKEGIDIENVSTEVAQAIEFNDKLYTIYIPSSEEEIIIKRKAFKKIILKGDIDGDNRITTKDDIDILMITRLEIIRKVNGLSDDYQFSNELIEESKNYFLEGNQTTVLAIQDGIAVGCASISYIEIMPTL